MQNDRTDYGAIYLAYFTGVSGSSLGLFLMKDGIIAGADLGGWKYDGRFTIDEASSCLDGDVEFTVPPGQISITGAVAGDEPLRISVPLHLPLDLARDEFHRIETPAGPINVRFELIRSI